MNSGESGRAPAVAVRTRAPDATGLAIQRKCACGGGAAAALTGECDDCQQKRLQRRASGAATPAEVPPIVSETLASPGDPLDHSARTAMESRFGHDFSAVRIHTGARAADSARQIGALAYTAGNDIVFGSGRYAPHSPAGRHLLAHELTHTLQSVAAGFSPPEADETGRLKPAATLRRQTEVSQPGDPAEAEADRTADQVTSGLIVEDDAAPGAGQMRKGEFLDEVQRASCAAADAELARAGRSTEGCPYIERAFGRYRTMPAAQVETMARRYVDPAGINAARDYIPRIGERVGQGVARWATTGDMSAVPAELASDFTGGGGGIVGMLGRLLFKRAADGTATPAETSMAATHLGRGELIDASARGRMEGAFGFDFSTVRIHNDARAAAASTSLGARAFTIGSDVAFGPGEYRPGTPAGDALLAHELAHVVQQSGVAGSDGSALDEDADRSAVGAVMNIWTGAKSVAASAIPRLRSGLRLQRCAPTQTLHTGQITGGGTVEAQAGPIALFGDQWVQLAYRGEGASNRRWLQFVWSEAIAETPNGIVRPHLFVRSTSGWANNETTVDPSQKQWHLDSDIASEPFYPSRDATPSSTPMYDRPRGAPDTGRRIHDAVPNASAIRYVQHFDTYLMADASIRPAPGPTGPFGIGHAIYHVQWSATTVYTDNGVNAQTPVYASEGGGNVSALPQYLVNLLDALYGAGQHNLR